MSLGGGVVCPPSPRGPDNNNRAPANMAASAEPLSGERWGGSPTRAPGGVPKFSTAPHPPTLRNWGGGEFLEIMVGGWGGGAEPPLHPHPSPPSMGMFAVCRGPSIWGGCPSALYFFLGGGG